MRVVRLDNDGAVFMLGDGQFVNYRHAVELRPYPKTRLVIRGALDTEPHGRALCISIRYGEDYYLASGYDPSTALTVSGAALIRTLAALKPAPVTVQPQEAGQQFKAMLSDVLIEGQYKPMAHQFTGAQFKVTHTRAFDLSTMRTGKTGSTMLALEWLFRQEQISHVLVLAPLSCVRPVWADALEQTLPLRVTRSLVGTRARREKQLKQPADIFVGTYTAIEMFESFWASWRPDVVVIDEVTHYANITTRRTRAIRSMIKDLEPRFVWGLTGTPGHDPIKAFCMSKVVNPDAVAVRAVNAWRELTMEKFGQQAWQWRPRPESPAYIKQALSPAILFKKEELFALPPVTYASREAEPSAEVLRMLNQLRTNMRTLSQSGMEITATQKSALVVKLLQCAAGCVHAGDDTAVLDIKDRLEVIKETIGESERKVVIFSPFVACLRRLCQSLQDAGVKAQAVDGGTPERARHKIFTQFQQDSKGESVDVLVAHPRTVAFGVELAAADLMIFDGAPLSGDFVFGQAVERLSSVKQTGTVSIINIYSCKEERVIYHALREGRDQSAAVAELFKTVTDVTNDADF